MQKSIEVYRLLRNVKIMKRRRSQSNTVSNGNDTPDTTTIQHLPFQGICFWKAITIKPV